MILQGPWDSKSRLAREQVERHLEIHGLEFRRSAISVVPPTQLGFVAVDSRSQGPTPWAPKGRHLLVVHSRAYGLAHLPPFPQL